MSQVYFGVLSGLIALNVKASELFSILQLKHGGQ